MARVYNIFAIISHIHYSLLERGFPMKIPRYIFIVCFIAMSIFVFPITSAYSDNEYTTSDEDDVRYVYLPGLGTHRVASVRSYSLSEITPDHPMYEIANRTLQRQFGVQDRSELAERANQTLAAHRRETWQQQRARERAFELRLSLIAIAIVSITGALAWVKKQFSSHAHEGDDFTTDQDSPYSSPPPDKL